MGWFSRLLGLETQPHHVVPVSDENFKAEVLSSDVPVLLDVWSDGCGPCKLLEPVVMELSRRYRGRLKVAELNVANAPRTARKLGITGTPTVVYFKQGREVERVVGFRAGHYHQAVVEETLLSPPSSSAAAPAS